MEESVWLSSRSHGRMLQAHDGEVEIDPKGGRKEHARQYMGMLSATAFRYIELAANDRELRLALGVGAGQHAAEAKGNVGWWPLEA
uniref:Uncharacterized protein n=1 Tax=Oryza sativa subsp. japonica TaxID=39947 RepID=Q6ZBQ4_ORYSJ|nr:hypothetical protein [Oryza sativa Japonica Group]